MFPDDADTLVQLFLSRAAADPDRPAVVHRRNDTFVPVTWGELLCDVRRAAAGFQGVGVAAGDRVVQVSENRYEWIVCDLAIMLAAGVHVPVHAGLSGPQIAFQIRDSGAKVVVVSGGDHRAKLGRELAADVTCVTFESCSDTHGGPDAMLWEEFIARAENSAGADVARSSPPRQKGDSLATILYTSGTTGDPKGVMLSHRNLLSNTRATVEAVGTSDEDLRLSILPWSHVFARTCDLYTWLACGCTLAIAEGREQVIANCAELAPTVINAVPYFYEKLFRHLDQHQLLETPGSLQSLLGGRMRLCCSGGAALPRHVEQMFDRQQLLLLQGYGLTETSPVISTGTPTHRKAGSVGLPLPGVEVRVAGDGEVLSRGPHIMQGYYDNRDATGQAIRDGWFHTGDLGRLDDEGYLFITGRKKEMIVLATGKNISPVNLETLLVEDPLIAQALVVGEGRKYLAALIVPDPDALKQQIIERRIPVLSSHQALVHPDVSALYRERIDRRLANVSAGEQVRQFQLLGRGFTPESDELTPTLKLRRGIIQDNFAKEIEAMYE